MKRFIYYFIITISIGIIVFLGYSLQIDHMENNEIGKYWYSLFPILVGMIIRFPKLILEFKRKQLERSIDWVKFVAIGIPCIYVSQIYLLYFMLPFGTSLPLGHVLVENANIPLGIIGGIAFGYTLLDSFNKKQL
ncbi:hypothetical protein PZE06_12445 [Robertmurraya sp. DFI.2.37]|uniref:hypothetical protein n=1 Tax=Robertmurraya sp. DFI.2.37 TaxID=3031819 RepID=UPI001248B211|nr:hypothetical protein [Robertmurraya sp. DFI.2.37]MDF1508980.1 hypothetical protein [Robertmurraya sp. DFI.2.37]